MSAALALFESVPSEEDGRISIEEMEDRISVEDGVAWEMLEFSRILRDLETEQNEPDDPSTFFGSPWTCYCGACQEARKSR